MWGMEEMINNMNFSEIVSIDYIDNISDCVFLWAIWSEPITIKKINNNNIAIAVDGENNEVIVFAKGIGYGNIPYEIKDLSVIERTFYDVDNRYYGLLKEIPNNIFNLVTKMVDVVSCFICILILNAISLLFVCLVITIINSLNIYINLLLGKLIGKKCFIWYQ